MVQVSLLHFLKLIKTVKLNQEAEREIFRQKISDVGTDICWCGVDGSNLKLIIRQKVIINRLLKPTQPNQQEEKKKSCTAIGDTTRFYVQYT